MSPTRLGNHWIDEAAAFAEVHGLEFRVGRRLRSVRKQVERYDLPPSLIPGVVTNALAADLYETFYARGGDEPAASSVGMANADLEAKLRAANPGSGPWEAGWRVVRQELHRHLVTKDGLTFSVANNRVRSNEPGVEIQHGAELARLSPGFYMFLGNTWLETRQEGLVRTYWHLTAAGAPHFVHVISRTLNEASQPFRAKVVSSRAGFGRRDAGVIYVPRDRWPDIAVRLRVAADKLDSFLGSGVPAMTKELQRGVGLAEDPSGGQSFGMSRCHIIASALVASEAVGGRDAAARAGQIRAAFEAQGLTPDRPYLGPGSEDRYTWPTQ